MLQRAHSNTRMRSIKKNFIGVDMIMRKSHLTSESYPCNIFPNFLMVPRVRIVTCFAIRVLLINLYTTLVVGVSLSIFHKSAPEIYFTLSPSGGRSNVSRIFTVSISFQRKITWGSFPFSFSQSVGKDSQRVRILFALRISTCISK